MTGVRRFRLVPVADIVSVVPVFGSFVAPVGGGETRQAPDCGIFWRSGIDLLASVVVLRGRWALTVQHVVGDTNGEGCHVTAPIAQWNEIRPANTFDVAGVLKTLVPALQAADLRLLRLEGDPSQAPMVQSPVFASEEEAAAATSVLVFGFGSDDCANSTRRGVKRFANLPMAPMPVTLELAVNPVFEFAVGGSSFPLTCPSDSGGGVYVDVGGALKLVGLIRGTKTASDGLVYSICVRVTPFIDWLNQVTG